MSQIPTPRLPFVGGGRREETNPYEEPRVAAAPASAPASAPAQSRTIPVSADVTQPGSVPQISGAALVDGGSPVNNAGVGNRPAPPAPAPQAAPQASTPQFDVPSAREEKKGFFGRLTSGFGGGDRKKKKEDAGGGIDASLFPEGAVASAGGSEASYASAPSRAPVSAGMPASTDSSGLPLPGAEPESERGGFSLPKPKLKVPKLGGDGGGGGSSPASATSVINNNGTPFYRVASTAQFMEYGESQMESEIRALPAGTLVQMTKPGNDWATVRLQDGREGVIRVGDLRAASAGEVPAQFGVPPSP